MAVNLAAWAQAHKPQLAIGGVGAAGVLGLVSARRRKTGTAAAPGATQAGTYSGPVQGGDPYGMTNDVVNSITPQLRALQQAVTALGLGTSAPQGSLPATPTPDVGILAPAGGYGAGASGREVTPGGIFAVVPGNEIPNIPFSSLFWQPTPGTFMPIPGSYPGGPGSLPVGVPQFIRAG